MNGIMAHTAISMETEITDEIKVEPNKIEENGDVSPNLEYHGDGRPTLEDIKASLERNYFNAKYRIASTFNAIKDSFLQDLNDILNRKLSLLEKMFQTDGSNGQLVSERHINSFQMMDFMTKTDVDLKRSLGYIRCWSARPDSFKLIVMTSLYRVGSEFRVLARGTEEWCPPLLTSFEGWMKDADENRIDARIEDERDGSYIFHFDLKHYGKYLISVTLYQQNVSNSPILIEIGNSEPKESNKRLRTSSREDVTKLENFHLPHRSTTVSDLDRKSNCYTKNRRNGIKGNLIATLSRENGVNLRYPIGLAVNSYHDIVICDTGNNLVWLVDEVGTPKRIIKPDVRANLYRPSAAVFLSDGSFVVKDECSLYHFDGNGLFIRRFEGNSLTRLYGLVSIQDDKLVTLNETEDSSLVVFDRDGRMECAHAYQPLENRPPNSKCRFMASYLDRLMVSDLGLSKIYKTTLEGRTTGTFGRYGRLEGEMIQPSGISFYRADTAGPSVLIADSRNDRIQYFDLYCQYLGTVQLSHAIRRPSDIIVTNDGWLYVLNYLDHYLAMYELESTEETVISTFDVTQSSSKFTF